MAITQNMNQFAQTPLKGMLAAIVNPTTISAMIDPNSVTTFYPGDLVRLTDTAGAPIMVEIAAASDVPFGVIIYTPKKPTWVAGDAVELALEGSVINVESNGVIARGQLLEWVPGSNQYKKWAGANPTCGRALDRATAAGQVIRMQVTAVGTPDTDYSSSSSCRSSSSSCRSSSSSSSSSSA